MFHSKKIQKILQGKSKPLSGNNRSRTLQAKRVTKRKFNTNRQKFQIGSQVYYVPVKLFRNYWAKLKKSL